MADQLERLKAALADRYTVEREPSSSISKLGTDGTNRLEQGP
jgi:hypothetical protein